MATKQIDQSTVTVTTPGVPVTQRQAEALVEAAAKLTAVDDAAFVSRLATVAGDVLKRAPDTLVAGVTRTPNRVEHAPPHVWATIREKS